MPVKANYSVFNETLNVSDEAVQHFIREMKAMSRDIAFHGKRAMRHIRACDLRLYRELSYSRRIQTSKISRKLRKVQYRKMVRHAS